GRDPSTLTATVSSAPYPQYTYASHRTHAQKMTSANVTRHLRTAASWHHEAAAWPTEETPVLMGRALRKLFPTLSELAATVGRRTYMSDGLITRHSADALQDPKFLAAYASGRATGSWRRM